MLQRIKEWLLFTRKERIGLATLLIIIAAVFILPPLLKKNRNSIPVFGEIKEADKKNKEGEKKGQDYNYSSSSFEENNNPVSLFNFDPNTASAADWKKLGLRDKTINTIQNYLSKGGHFYKPADLKKIYGLNSTEFERLLPYISIAGASEKNYADKREDYVKKDYSNEQYSSSKPAPAYKKKEVIIDINTADTSGWGSLPGIGSKRAWSIVNFRNKLGGFYSIEQVGETYNIPDSIFQKIKPMLQLNASDIKRININTARKEELKMHPYIKWAIANAITEYRNQHGNFSSVEQIKNIVLITPDIFTKIAPYLSVD